MKERRKIPRFMVMRPLSPFPWLFFLTCPLLTVLASEHGYKPKAPEIPVPMEPRSVQLTPLQSFNPPIARYSSNLQWHVRRITKDRFELWTPKEGWLFNAKGEELYHVHVPRRDGTGREWFGAFLPDGRWVTTDLWDMDCTLACFSPEGKWLWEIPSRNLIQAIAKATDQKHLLLWKSTLLAWARSDGKGEGWVVGVGSEDGIGAVWVDPERQVRFLPSVERWQTCYPRMLGTRGFYAYRGVSSDDGSLMLFRGEGGHGPRVGYPWFSLHRTPPNWENKSSKLFSVVIPNGDHGNFGFWPESTRTYVSRADSWNPQGHDEKEEEIKDMVPANGSSDLVSSTWFFDSKGTCEGWVWGRRLADFPNQQGMFFATDQKMVVGVSDKLKATSARVFRWDEQAKAIPCVVYPELRLGFFLKGKQPVLASFREKMGK